MSDRRPNLLFILSDQHARDVAGCYGHPMVQTPHLDALAARGTRFANAYTNSPLCVPARASLATGRYVHDIGHWDNAFPYHGEVTSWHHRVREAGLPMDSIGKLHFRSADDDNGFGREIEPLHVVDGIGDILGCIREDPPVRERFGSFDAIGPGESTYLAYDERNASNGVDWIRQHAGDDEPWVLFLSFVLPHPPYIAPPELCDLYPRDRVPLPTQWRREDWPAHRVLELFRQFFDYTQGFDEEVVRRLAATYYGMVTYLDRQIGRVLETLGTCGLEDSTRVVYTTDHGDCLGARGVFGKFTLYEESAAVPMIAAGPGVPAGRIVDTPVSLIDVYPSVLEAVGVERTPAEEELPGESLWSIAAAADRDRTVFCEYHALASQSAHFMLRDRQYKYNHYVGEAPQLYNLSTDPREVRDLAADPDHRAVLERFEAQLRELLDPEGVDAQAKADQRARIEAFGGEAAVRRRGSFENSPAPGETPVFRHGS